MPIIKSAKKRVRVAQKASVRNSKTKRTLKDAVKSFQSLLSGGNATKINEAYTKAQSAVDSAAKKNVIHKNKAARKKAQLSKQMKDAKVKVTPGKPAAKKPIAKKPAAKKPVAKKTTKK